MAKTDYVDITHVRRSIEKGWTKGHMGDYTTIDAPVCLTGALYREPYFKCANGHQLDNTMRLIADVIGKERALDLDQPEEIFRTFPEDVIVAFNDDAATKKEDVLQLLDEVNARTWKDAETHDVSE